MAPMLADPRKHLGLGDNLAFEVVARQFACFENERQMLLIFKPLFRVLVGRRRQAKAA